MEQVKVIETSSVEWQSTVLAVVLHLHLELAGNYDIPTPCLQGKCSAAELCQHVAGLFPAVTYWLYRAYRTWSA